MEKIQMTTPLVEMDGDEMTRILWKMIKDELLLPFIDLKTEYYDLGLEHRNETNDQVTVDSANATKKYGVAVKCATITPNAARMTEYNLKEMWKSPNGTIRAMLDGTVFRTPIVVKGIEPCVRNWKKPITIARHAYGDVYKNAEMRIPGPGKAELVYTAEDGTETRELIHNFTGAGVIQGMHNLDNSIESFARSCFEYALSTKQDLWFATKDTISKKYDHTFKDIFQEIYDTEYKEKFEKNNLDLIIKNDVTPVMIQADGRHLWRVFDNLMNNINKYAQPGTRVYIDIIPKDGGAIITFKNVSATPLNISSDELKERFVRGDSSRNTEGSGLGLSIAESLMKLMNGTLELTVDGDLFKVTLEF